MTERDAFKLGFLERSAAAGRTPDEMLADAQAALALVKGAGVVDALKGLGTKTMDIGYNTVSGLAPYGVAALGIAPIAAGGAVGYAGAKLSDIGDTDVAEIRNRELLDEYRRSTDKLKRQKAVRDYHQALLKQRSRPLL